MEDFRFLSSNISTLIPEYYVKNYLNIFRGHQYVEQSSSESDISGLWELQPPDQYAFETVRAGQGSLQRPRASVHRARKGQCRSEEFPD